MDRQDKKIEERLERMEEMLEQSRENRRKGYVTMRMVYDVTMALVILGIGVIMLMAERWNISHIIELNQVMRYMFCGLCFLYGGFRLYRGIKREY